MAYTLTFGAKLNLMRCAQGWSQAELARRAQIAKSMVGYYESGQGLPGLEIAQRLARLFPEGHLLLEGIDG